MSESFRNRNNSMRQFLSQYLDHLADTHTARQLVLTLMIVHEERLKPILSVTQVNQQQTFDEFEHTWLLPTPPQYTAITACHITQSPDSKCLYVPIMSRNGQADDMGSECIGLLAIESTKNISAALQGHFGIETDHFLNWRIAFEEVRLYALLRWQREVMQTLQGVSRIDLGSHEHEVEWAYQQILDAALIIAPIACVAHIITVKRDSPAEPPSILRFTYAAASTRNSPTGELACYGAYPETEEYEYGIDEGVTGYCVRERTRKYHPDLTYVRPLKVAYGGSQSEVCYPLMMGELVIGVLNLESESKAAFSDNDIENLQILANEAALILLAKSDLHSRMNLLDRGVRAFPAILQSLDTPHDLVKAVLEWTRHLGTPPFEFARFTADGPFYEFESITVPGAVSRRPEQLTVLSLAYGSVFIGTLELASLHRPEAVKQQSKILESLLPVLSATLHSSLTLWLSSRRDRMVGFGSKIRHTIQRFSNSLQTAQPSLFDRETRNSITGVLQYLRILGDVIAHGTGDGHGEPPTEFINVLTRVEEVANAFRWRFEAEGLILETVTDLHGVTPPVIVGHHSTFQWALIELLDNALKFSKAQKKKRVRLSVLCYHGSPDVIITVDDECERIPVNELDKIWKRGAIGVHALADGTGGSGQGLATVDWCVDHLNGKRAIHESKSLGGNSFKLSFPTI